MKNLIYILLTFFLFVFSTYSQQKDSLIQLYPGLGDTINLFDRNYFELFQNIDGYEFAVFYIRNNEQLVSKVTYTAYGILRDTTFVQRLSALNDARETIKKIEIENEKKFDSPKNYSIKTISGKEYLGKIVMFSKNKIYFRTEEDFSNDPFNTSNFKLDFSKVETLTLVGETNTWSCMGYGALIGLGIGLIGVTIQEASGSGSGYAIFGIPLFAIFSGLVGLVFGLASSSGDEVIPIDYQADLLQLKGYAKYYFGYDESVKELYKEIE